MAFQRRLPWLFTLVSQLWPVVPELLRLWFRSNIIFIKRGLDFAPEGRLGSFGNRFGIHVAFHGQVLVFSLHYFAFVACRSRAVASLV